MRIAQVPWRWMGESARARCGHPMPPSLNELRIHNLEVAGATVDLLFVRHHDDCGVNVLRLDGDVQIMVIK